MAWIASQRIPIPRALHDLSSAKDSSSKRKRVGKGKPSKTRVKDDSGPHPGPIAVLHDQVRSEGWVLVTHGGAYTELHHDAEGFATYVVVNHGAKIWVPKGPKPSTSIHTRVDLFEALDHFFDRGHKKPDDTLGGSMLLEPGDVLYAFIPPLLRQSHENLIGSNLLEHSTRSTRRSSQLPREDISSPMGHCI
jgi:hypothetical protein